MCDNKHEKSHKCLFAPFSANSPEKGFKSNKTSRNRTSNRTKTRDCPRAGRPGYTLLIRLIMPHSLRKKQLQSSTIVLFYCKFIGIYGGACKNLFATQNYCISLGRVSAICTSICVHYFSLV